MAAGAGCIGYLQGGLVRSRMALCSTASASVRCFEGLTGLSGSGPSYLMPSQRGFWPLVFVALNSAFTTSDLSPFSACKGSTDSDTWRGPGHMSMLHGSQHQTALWLPEASRM